MRWLLLAAVGVFAAGCGPDCLSTCQRLHADGVDAQGENQCNLTVPGMEAAQLIRECAASCERAMARAGTLDGYDPNKRTPPSEAQELKNDRQAAEASRRRSRLGKRMARLARSRHLILV
ncbi:MAG TPA: hypothetical protein PKY30_14255 [Myxococcota bacterium]|nr:hypothetical protein [Myxococcota bacterium]